MRASARKIAKWVENGLISDEQGRKILAFERRGGGLTPASAAVFLGALSIAWGVVAVVAANWAAVPDAFKLAAMFVLLTGTAVGAAKCRETRPTAFEGLLLFYMIALFAAIGLVGQIYHLKSDTYAAFLFWSGLAFPPVCLTRKTVAGYIWDYVFLGAFFASPPGRSFLDWLTVPPVCVSFLCFAAFAVLARRNAARAFVQPMRVFFFVGTLAFLLVKDRSVHVNPAAVAACWGAMILFAVFVLKAGGFSKSEQKPLGAVVGLYAVSALLPDRAAAGYFSELAVLIALVFAAHAFDMEKTARGLTVVAGFRILFAYFDLFGSLMSTGVGMILSGAVILAVAFAGRKATGYLKKDAVAAKGENHG